MKPVIIEFLGMPRAGKTLQLELLRRHLESFGRTVTVVSDREVTLALEASGVDVNTAYEYNKRFFAEIERRVRDARTAVVLLDRGFYDGPAWSIAHAAVGEMTIAERDAGVVRMRALQPLVTCAFLFTLDIATARARHEAKGEHDPTDHLLYRDAFMLALRAAYDELQLAYAGNSSVRVIDGLNAPEETTSRIWEIASSILEQHQ